MIYSFNPSYYSFKLFDTKLNNDELIKIAFLKHYKILRAFLMIFPHFAQIDYKVPIFQIKMRPSFSEFDTLDLIFDRLDLILYSHL